MIVKVLWASSSGQTQGDRANLHVEFFFRVLIVDRGQRASKEEAEDAASTSMKNRSQTDRKSTKIDENLILGGFGRSKPFRGRAGTRSGRDWDDCKPPQGRSWDAPGEPKAARKRFKSCPGRSRDALRQPWNFVLARSVYQALSNALAGRFFDVFVSLRESSRLKIRAPTQCFVRVGGSHESGRTSGDEARKSMLFGLQNRRRGRPGDPKSSASALGRAKKRSMSARSIAIFFTLGANEASQSEKVRVGGAVGALMSELPGPSSRILDRDSP